MFLLIFILINLSNSNLYEYIDLTISDNKENRLNKCSCDKRDVCNFRCCCDEKCGPNLVEKWREQKICENIERDKLNKNMCISTKESFDYNSKNAGITIKDHIFNIMCIKYDNSGEMKEEYVEKEEEEDENSDQIWIDNFFNFPSGSSNKNVTYGQNISEIKFIFKPDSNGRCVKNQKIYYLKPFETSCIMENYQMNEFIPTERYGKGDLKEVTYLININDPTDIKTRGLYTERNNTNYSSVKFIVKWINDGSEENNLRRSPGYLQGNPIYIKNTTDFSEKGYFLPVSDKDGNCVEDINEITNINYIKFKQNLIVSCRLNGDFKKTTIYKYLCENELIISKYADLSDDIKVSCNFESRHLILEIITSNKGKESSPQNYIVNATFIEANNNLPDDIFFFMVKFVEITYDLIENSNQGKITSNPLMSKSLLDDLKK